MSDETGDPTIASLEAIQNFDPAMIARTETLGSVFDFTPAMPAVGQVVDFFRLLPKQLVPSLPDAQRTQVQVQADAWWGTIQQMMQFDPNTNPNPAIERQTLIAQLKGQMSEALNQLGSSVAFVTAKQRSTSGVEAEARTLLEAARQNSEEIERLKKETAEESQRILAGVRSIAAEAGVSQQAGYFGDQAAKHAAAAVDWQKNTYITAAVLVIFALITWFLGFWVVPTTAYQAIQFGLSKLLIFTTVAFILFLCSRTLMAHRHNEVVNRHRQNALLTFNALADAATTPETKDVVLTHASACIYAPQESGFSKPSGVGAAPSLIEVLPRIMGSQHTA